MFERFTRDARAAVVSTQEVCRDTGADEVRPVHLLLALTHEGSGVRDLLARHGITTDAVADGLGIAPPARPTPLGTPLGDDDAAALRSLGIDLDAIRSAVERQFGEGALDEPSPDADQGAGTVAAQGDRDEQSSRGRFGRGGHIRFGRGARKVLELALREAVRSGAREIRTEHVALGLLRVDDEALGLLVRRLGVDRQAVRADLESHGRRTA